MAAQYKEKLSKCGDLFQFLTNQGQIFDVKGSWPIWNFELMTVDEYNQDDCQQYSFLPFKPDVSQDKDLLLFVIYL